ncbi:MAG: hypothetical protein J3Q66DRAFT_336016 [Benniella sp.]|nr:MAG: hypothetical protein J3Q66DRAFT_336016 [Benniella sp.]
MALLTFHKSKRLPRLIVTDLDGTLLTPQYTISPRSVDTLLFAQSFSGSSIDPDPVQDPLLNPIKSGEDAPNNSGNHHPIQIMIASGRSPRSVQKVIDLFQGRMIPDAVICCNGALNYNPKTKVISYPQFIPLDQAIFMIQEMRTEICHYGTRSSRIPASNSPLEQNSGPQDLTPLPVQEGQDETDPFIAGRPGFSCEVIWFEGVSPSGEPIYAQDTSFVCDRTWELQRKGYIYYDYSVVEDTMEAFLQSLQQAALNGTGRSGGVIKIMVLDRNRSAPELYESLPETLRPTSMSSVTTTTTIVPTTTATSPAVSVTYSGKYFLEIAAAGVNKGLGLAKYCEAHTIPREEVVAFGDLLNDAEMLQFAGLGLCMGNGHEEMKKLADRVIGTNAEDGVAQEIESWFV